MLQSGRAHPSLARQITGAQATYEHTVFLSTSAVINKRKGKIKKKTKEKEGG